MSSEESLRKESGLKINFLKLKSIAITNINTDDPATLLCAAGYGLFLRLAGGGGGGCTLQPGRQRLGVSPGYVPAQLSPFYLGEGFLLCFVLFQGLVST